MEHLRDGIGLRGYGQRDPKQEYKKEGYNLFVNMMAARLLAASSPTAQIQGAAAGRDRRHRAARRREARRRSSRRPRRATAKTKRARWQAHRRARPGGNRSPFPLLRARPPRSAATTSARAEAARSSRSATARPTARRTKAKTPRPDASRPKAKPADGPAALGLARQGHEC